MILNRIDVSVDGKSVSVEWINDGVSHRRAFTVYDKAEFKELVADKYTDTYIAIEKNAEDAVEKIFYEKPSNDFKILSKTKTIDVLKWESVRPDIRQEWLKNAPLFDPNKITTVKTSQAKIALVRAGLYSGILDYIDTLPRDNEIRVWWETAENFVRDFPALLEVAEQLNLSDEQLDDLFLAASKIG